MPFIVRMATACGGVQGCVAVGAKRVEFLVPVITGKRACIGPQPVRHCLPLIRTDQLRHCAVNAGRIRQRLRCAIGDALPLFLQPDSFLSCMFAVVMGAPLRRAAGHFHCRTFWSGTVSRTLPLTHLNKSAARSALCAGGINSIQQIAP